MHQPLQKACLRDIRGGMPTCYSCGKPITTHERFRRKVKTGEVLRRRFATSKPSAITTRFGMRTVCRDCAHKLDAEWRRHELVQYIELAIAIGLLLLVILARLFR